MTAAFYFFPAPGGPAVEIDLNEDLSDLQFNPSPNQSISEGLGGRQAITSFSNRATVRTVFENFTNPAIVRALYLLEDHLKRGGVVAVATNKSAAWAGYLLEIPGRGDTSFEIAGQPFQYQGTPPTAPDGDELEFLGSQPLALRERQVINGDTTGSTISIDSGLLLDFASQGASWVLARHRGFWPVLRLPADFPRSTPLLTHDHQLHFTWDAPLEEAIDVLSAMAFIPDSDAVTTTEDPEVGQISPEDLNAQAGVGGVRNEPLNGGGGGGGVLDPSLPGVGGVGGVEPGLLGPGPTGGV